MPFDVRWEKTETLSGDVVIRDGRIKKSIFTWHDNPMASD